MLAAFPLLQWVNIRALHSNLKIGNIRIRVSTADNSTVCAGQQLLQGS